MFNPDESTNYVCYKLAWLASEAAFQRWVVGATRSHNLLPDELINDAYEVVEAVQRKAASVNGLLAEEREAVLTLGRVVESLAPSVDSVSSLEEVAVSTAYAGIRNAARECLLQLGFNLRQWEQENVSQAEPAAGA